jgi:hypothetical protein
MSRALALILLFAVAARAEGPADIYSDRRKDLQGRFSVAQKAIYPDPASATVEAVAAMAKVNSALIELKADYVNFERNRYRNWYNRSYWRNYWDSGPGAHRILDKLAVQLDKINTLSAKQEGPYGRPDLNDSQKLLDAIREALLLDAELSQIVRTYLSR